MIKNRIKYLVIGIIAAMLVFSLCGCISISVTKVDSLSGKFNSEFETDKDKDTYVHGFGGGAKIQVDSMSGDITICMQK